MEGDQYIWIVTRQPKTLKRYLSVLFYDLFIETIRIYKKKDPQSKTKERQQNDSVFKVFVYIEGIDETCRCFF